MDIREAIDLVESSDVYQEDGYLAHGFMSFSRGEDGQWQIGYYDGDTDRITSYHIDGSHVSRAEPAEVFKEGQAVPRLDLNLVTLHPSDATKVAHERLSSKYSQHPLMKTILLLQTIDGVAVYNFTLVTQSLHMFNVRVHAGTKEIISETLEPLMNLRADQD